MLEVNKFLSTSHPTIESNILLQMWKKFRWTDDQRRKEIEKAKAEEERKPADITPGMSGSEPPQVFGTKPSEWNQWHISLVPKFLMADGELTNVLHKTGVTRYIELLQVGGSYVVKSGVPYRVPSTRMEAVTSSLVSKFQKFYMQNFLQFIANYKEDDTTTHKKGNIFSGLYYINEALSLISPV